MLKTYTESSFSRLEKIILIGGGGGLLTHKLSVNTICVFVGLTCLFISILELFRSASKSA
jgi:hypothetical protein